MSSVVAWFVIGVPSVAVAAAMFLGRSPRRAQLGYVALIAGFGAMAAVDRVSAGVLGGVIALLYAAGRGGEIEWEAERADETAVPEVDEDTGHGHVGTSTETPPAAGTPAEHDRGAAGVR